MENLNYFAILYFIAALYPIYIRIVHGKHRSISLAFYSLKKKDNWMFAVFCWSLMVGALPFMYHPLSILASVGLLFLGAAGHYKDHPDYPKTIYGYPFHIVGSYTVVLSSMAALWVHYGSWYLTILFIIAALYFIISKNEYKTTYIEEMAIAANGIQILIMLWI